MIPASGAIAQNQAVTFTATYSHPSGLDKLKTVYFLVNASTGGAYCFLGYYDLDTNSLYLRDDADTTWLGGLNPGGYNNFIQNSQVYFDCASSSVLKSGNTLTLTWAVNFKSTFSGIKNIYLKAIDKSNSSTDFVQKGDFCIFRAAVTPPG